MEREIHGCLLGDPEVLESDRGCQDEEDVLEGQGTQEVRFFEHVWNVVFGGLEGISNQLSTSYFTKQKPIY